MKNLTVDKNITIRKSMKLLSKSGHKSLVIIDKNNNLKGTISDGDIRKAILNGAEMTESIKKYYQPKPTVLIKNRFKNEDAKDIFTKNKFDLIPIIDKEGILFDILLWENVFLVKVNQSKKLI